MTIKKVGNCMTRKFMIMAVCVCLLIVGASCSTAPLLSGNARLVIRVLPDPLEGWKTALIYLNGQYVDTAVPGSDEKSYDLAPGKYSITVKIEGYETWKESVTLFEGQKKQYIELHPKKTFVKPLSSSIHRFLS